MILIILLELIALVCLLLVVFLALRPEIEQAILPAPQPSGTLEAVVVATQPPEPTATPTTLPTPTPTPAPSPTTTPTPLPTPTPDPYAGLTIADLVSRAYGGGVVEIVETLDANEAFTRYLITYPSEGLTLYGFMNVPQREGHFPVAVVMHGYIAPEQYNTIAYTTRYADTLARAGYLVIHPNYRNWPPSDKGPELFRTSHAVDALNLIAIIRAQAGQPGPLEKADPNFIGMLGHSMGGGITLRVMTVSNALQAAVLYGAMSGDEKRNYEKIWEWSGGSRGSAELEVSETDLARISSIFYLDRITAPVSIHHGDNDGTVPLQWSVELCQNLRSLGKAVECFTYPGQPHTFQGEGDQLFMQRVIEFFNRQVELSK
jgi:dienelactone hydrolase